MIEDVELLRSYAESRSEAAFAELVRRRVGLVYSVAWQWTRDAHLAEDATQAVFTDLARKARKLSKHAVLAGWLYRSAHYAATNILRTEQSRAAREKEAQLMHEMAADDRPPDSWEKVKPLLIEVMSELDERDRNAILLRFFDGCSFAEVGGKLRLTENAARMRVDRALDKLHAALARRDIKSTTAVLGAVFAQQAMTAAPAGLAASVTSGAVMAAVSAPALMFFQIMTTTKMVTGLAGVALTIAVLGTAYEIQVRRATEATLVSVTTERGALDARLGQLEQRAAAAEREAALLKQRAEDAARAEAAAKAKAAAMAQASKTKTPWDPVAEGKALLARHPELKRVFSDGTDAGTRFIYGGIYQSLGLTPSQIARYEELMREWSSTSVPWNGEQACLSVGTGRSWKEVNDALTALLGEEKKQKLRDYGQAAPDRQLTASVASALCFTDSPLTPTQAAQLAEMIGSSRARPQSWGPGELDWAAFTAKARAVLSGPQIAVLEGLQAQAAEQALLYAPIK